MTSQRDGLLHTLSEEWSKQERSRLFSFFIAVTLQYPIKMRFAFWYFLCLQFETHVLQSGPLSQTPPGVNGRVAAVRRLSVCLSVGRSKSPVESC